MSVPVTLSKLIVNDGKQMVVSDGQGVELSDYYCSRRLRKSESKSLSW